MWKTSNGNPLYVIHFPGKKLVNVFNLLDRDIKIDVDNRIAIISECDYNTREASLLHYQCKLNDIPIFSNMLECNPWFMIGKIYSIYNLALQLKHFNYQYILNIDSRDTLLTNNLDDNFIRLYHDKFDNKVVYNVTSNPYPTNIGLEPIELDIANTNNTYLNAGVCFGTIDSIVECYKKCILYCNTIKSFKDSEQFYIRNVYSNNPDLIALDTNYLLFKTVHENFQQIDIRNEVITDVLQGNPYDIQ